jgi:lysozyme family protein
MANFETAYNNTVVKNEGGYRNVSWDAETYRGINRNVWPMWAGWPLIDSRKPIAHNTVFNDLEPLVKSFYLQNFWSKIYGPYIKSQPIANIVFDYYVQSGPYAIEKVQQAVNTVQAKPIAVDGVLGNDTLSALNNNPEYKVNNALLETRRAHYQSLFENGTFSANDWQGVLNRLASFPYLKETLLGGTIVAVLLVGFFIFQKFNP